MHDADDGPLLDRRDRIAAVLLGRPLSAVLGLLCLWELATWAPNYLTWPLWPDHDVFATAATGWVAGRAAVSRLRGEQLPRHDLPLLAVRQALRLRLVLGPSMYGFDAALVAILGVALRRLERPPVRAGVAGPGRLWRVPGLLPRPRLQPGRAEGLAGAGASSCSGILLVQAWRRADRADRWRRSWRRSGWSSARRRSCSCRPRRWPSATEARRRERSAVLAVVEWAVAAGRGARSSRSLPLILAGLWGDFRESLKVVAYGGKYNLVTAGRCSPGRCSSSSSRCGWTSSRWGSLLLASRLGAADAPTAWPWLVAFLGVLLYRPLSPHPHAYLTHPLMLVWSVLAAVLVQMLLDREELSASVKLAAVLLVIGLGLSAKPRFSNPNGSREAFAVLKTRREPGPKPTGYVANPTSPTRRPIYNWADYRDLLDYLRRETSPIDPDRQLPEAGARDHRPDRPPAPPSRPSPSPG